MNGESNEDTIVKRIANLDSAELQVLEEYYVSVGVVKRDDAEAMRHLLEDTCSGMWLAYVGEEIAGCVVLKAGVPDADAGECKRLYVRPQFRRRGVAEGLMDALEDFASGAGLRWIYLDTNATFAAAVPLYERRGYRPCPRYNDNPQATMFFRKRVPAADEEVLAGENEIL